MHVPDGILPLTVTLGGYAICAAVTSSCVRHISRREDPREEIPKAALLTAAFFLASLIHLPLPPASVHLILNGLLGVLLGAYAFPAIVVGLFFQAVMLGHGGLTTLGINSLILGLPALLAGLLYRMGPRRTHVPTRRKILIGAIAGSTAVALSVILFSLVIGLGMPAHVSASAERSALLVLILSHIPLMIAEGAATGFLVAFLLRTRPQLLEGLS